MTKGNVAAPRPNPSERLRNTFTGSGHQDSSLGPVTEVPREVMIKLGISMLYMTLERLLLPSGVRMPYKIKVSF